MGPLARDEQACAACGRAVAAGDGFGAVRLPWFPPRPEWRGPGQDPRAALPVPPVTMVTLTRCATCADRYAAAVTLADATPVRRLDEPPWPPAEGSTPGPRLRLRPTVDERRGWYEAATVAAARLDLGSGAVADLLAAHVELRWMASPRFAPGYANDEPWGHVDETMLASARRQYSQAVRWRMARHAEPVEERCPSTACLLCGVAVLSIPARRHWRARVEGHEGWWRPRTVTVGRRPIDGHVCWDCADLIADAGTVHAALVTLLRAQYAGAPTEQPTDVIGLAWASVDRPANIERWQHLPDELEVADGDVLRLMRRRVVTVKRSELVR
jgi:hypothetical protein